MCKYTQTLYACGHPRYTLKRSCPSHTLDARTAAAYCGSEANTPGRCVAETIAHMWLSCGGAECGYRVEDDPFLAGGDAWRVGSGSGDVDTDMVVREVEGEVEGEVEVGEVAASVFYGGVRARKEGLRRRSGLKPVMGAGVRKPVRRGRGKSVVVEGRKGRGGGKGVVKVKGGNV